MKRSHALFDIAVLAVYLLAANPALTGIPLHEFLGLGAFIMVAAHVVESGEGLGGRGRVGQLVLNAVLLLALAVCVVSGYHFWDPLHAVAAKVLLAALLVHLVVRAPAALAVLRQRRGLRAAESDCLMGR